MPTDTTSELTIPTVHLNGSGAKNLNEQYRGALEALREARRAIPVPHGRDYYLQEKGAFERARAQFEGQLRKLEAVEEELSGILLGIMNQGR